MYKKFKRFGDIIISAFLLILLIPVFIVVPIFIVTTMGFPVFFRQKRIGLRNQLFEIYKFRTMLNSNKNLSSDSKRITVIGRILRISRIDELPQLYNILRGDMSFIGPRPLLSDYLPYYTAEEIRRHKVRPGLSGLSQVIDLNYPKWEIQFERDIYYVDNISFRLDFYIFTKTISKIFKPSSMMKTGISGGRLNFDVYRKSQLNSNPDITDNTKKFNN